MALICVVAIWGVRDYQHRRAVSAMNSFVYHEAEPLRLAAYPYMINPFRWHGVVETRDFLETVPVNSLAPDVDSDTGILYYKPPVTDVLNAAEASYMGRVYLDWAVFPYVREANLGERGGHLVEFQDLRYTYPSSRGQAPLSGYVLLSPNLRVIEEGMNSSRSAAVEALEQAGRER